MVGDENARGRAQHAQHAVVEDAVAHVGVDC